jgi:hypothetical protein
MPGLELCPDRPAISPKRQQKKLSPVVIKPRILLPRASLLLCSLSRAEGDHFDYFRTVCATIFSGYFHDSIWETLILQISYLEPCIRHAAIAIGALHLLVRTAIARHQESRAIHWMKNFQEESSQRFYRDFLLKIFPCMWDTNSVYIGGVRPTESKEFKLFIVLINSIDFKFIPPTR